MENYENLVKEIVQQYKCENCEDFLNPPICICAEGTIICGPCSELQPCKEQVVTRCSILENIEKFLTFPCAFSNYGCTVQLPIKNASKHESRCPFQQLQCPICLECDKRWCGTAKNMNLHIKNNHLDVIIDANNTQYQLADGKTVKLFFSKQDLYAIIWKCSTNLDALWCSVKLVGTSVKIQRSYFKLTINCKDSEKYCETNLIEVANNWEIDLNTAIKINLSVLKAKLQLKSDIAVDTKIEICVRKSLYDGSIYEHLLYDTVCLVCHDYMSATIFECISGHSFCGDCKPKLNHCPLCRAKIDNRNFELESISKQILYKCLYSDNGCTYTSLLKHIFTHEKMCSYGQVECPLKSFITKCNWRGKLHQLHLHALDDHGVKF